MKLMTTQQSLSVSGGLQRKEPPVTSYEMMTGIGAMLGMYAGTVGGFLIGASVGGLYAIPGMLIGTPVGFVMGMSAGYVAGAALHSSASVFVSLAIPATNAVINATDALFKPV